MKFSADMEVQFTIFPLEDSPIIHEVAATSCNVGHQAFVFFKAKQFKVTSQFHVKGGVQDNTVYFITTNDFGEAHKPFKQVHKDSMALPVQVYLNLLEYFSKVWPRVETVIKVKVDQMRKAGQHTMMERNLGFIGNGILEPSPVFLDENTLLLIQVNSRDLENKVQILLQRGGQQMQLSLPVMVKLSQNLDTLKKINSKFGGGQSANQMMVDQPTV